MNNWVRWQGWMVVGMLLVTGPTTARAEQVTAEQALANADEVRNPQLDYTMHVTVTSFRPKGTPRKAVYEVLIKGRDRSVIKTLSPPADKGRILLMRDNDLWAYLPTVSKPLRISLRERLIGEIANGDLARTNFSGDYTPSIERMETRDDRAWFVLNLVAKTPDVTYAKAVLWVDAKTFHPHHAEFYAVSGRLLKTCQYERYTSLAGRLRPSRLIMEDPLSVGQYSVLEYESMEVRELPEKYFTKDYMKKFME